MNKKTLTMLAMGVSILGGVVSILNNYIEDKQLDNTINDKINEKLAEVLKDYQKIGE